MFLFKDIFFWEFIPFLWIFFFSVGISLFLCLMTCASALFIVPKRNLEQKLSGYECGFEAFSDARMCFDVRFWIISILFLLFDVELIYLFPFAVLLPFVSFSGFWMIEIFMLIVGLGFIFEYFKGALDWQSI